MPNSLLQSIELVLMASSEKAIKISQKHLLGIQDLSIKDIHLILDEAKKFISLNKSKNKKLDILRGKTQINLGLSSQNINFFILTFVKSYKCL